MTASTQTPARPVQPMPVLMDHQQMIHDFIVSHPYVGAWLGVGAGKTLTTLSALQTIRPIGHILVVAPVAIARSTWIDEIEKWGFPIRTRSLIVNERDKKLTKVKRLARYAEVFTDPPTMYFINQELVADLVEQMPTTTVMHNGKPVQAVTWPFHTLIIDESQAFKSHGSGRFQALQTVRPAISRVIELTGTPAPNGLHDLWSQVYLLDQGQALGHNITAFRNRWFTAKTYNGVPTKWLPVPGAEAEIHKAIAHLVMSVQNTDLNLPDLMVEDVHVSLPPDLIQAYKEFKTELVLDIVVSNLDDDQLAKGLKDPDVFVAVQQIVAENQAVLTNKLLQFANGALYTGDPDDPSTKGQYTVIHEQKLEMAEYLIRNNNNSPVLVAYAFASDKELLLKRLNAAGIAAEAFDGSRGMLHRWNTGSIPVMLIHPASAGHGLNLQDGGHTLLWYGLTYNLEHYIQTNGRLYRKGQTKPVTIYRLMTRGTQDERLPVVLASKQAEQDRLLDFVDGEVSTLAALEAEIFDDLNDLWSTTRL